MIDNRELYLKAIGKVIATHRKHLRVTQEEMADRINAERSYYGKIEQGKINFSMVRLISILGVLEVSWEDFFRRLEKEIYQNQIKAKALD